MKFRKLTAVGVVAVSVAAVAPVVAVAKDGGDDPPGDMRGGHGADDRSTTAAKTAAPQSTAATRTLRGTVGPGYTIALKLNGKKVKTLKAGRYKLVVSDRASSHNYELERKSGAEFEKELTDVSFTGTKTTTLTLKQGKWKYYCEPHESMMRGFFTVK